MTDDKTPIERGVKAMEREYRTSDHDGHALTRAMVRAAFTDALDLEDLAEFLMSSDGLEWGVANDEEKSEYIDKATAIRDWILA